MKKYLNASISAIVGLFVKIFFISKLRLQTKKIFPQRPPIASIPAFNFLHSGRMDNT